MKVNDNLLRKYSCIEEKTTKLRSYDLSYADNCFLPFNLLAANTLRPPFVLMRALNPWTLALDLFFGWNVIFIGKAPPLSIVNFKISHRTSFQLYSQTPDSSRRIYVFLLFSLLFIYFIFSLEKSLFMQIIHFSFFWNCLSQQSTWVCGYLKFT